MYCIFDNGMAWSKHWPWYVNPAWPPPGFNTKPEAVQHARKQLQTEGITLPDFWQGESFEYLPGKFLSVEFRSGARSWV